MFYQYGRLLGNMYREILYDMQKMKVNWQNFSILLHKYIKSIIFLFYTKELSYKMIHE
jgi:hypothetical protein